MTETSGRWDRRNFLLNTFEGALYVTGTSLISGQTVMPALVFRLGGGTEILAILSIINWAGVYLPQIFASRYGQHLAWKKPWVVWFGLLQRMFILLIGIALFASSPESKSTTLFLFLMLYVLNQLTVGITSPVWFDFYAKLIRRQFRGRSMGARTALAGIMSLGGTVLLTYILTAYDFPTNFAILFVIAFMFEFISIVLQALLVEEFPSVVTPQRSLRFYLRDVVMLLKGNSGFRRFLTASGIIILGTLPLGFFTIYAITQFHLDERSAGGFTLLMVGGQIFGAIVIGYLADRVSNKSALAVTTATLLLSSAAALIAPSPDLYRVVFIMLGIFLGSEMMIRYNLAIEFGPPQLRSTLIGIMNTFLAPCYAIALCGSWIISVWGYTILFLVGALFALGGLVYLIAAVREPPMLHHPEPALARPEESVIPEQ